jgi:hypothetical protein
MEGAPCETPAARLASYLLLPHRLGFVWFLWLFLRAWSDLSFILAFSFFFIVTMIPRNDMTFHLNLSDC